MNGAQSLVDTLHNCGIDICFANPGTSEMQIVAALDQQPGIRSVLGLFEGVVTGAADGYSRMADRPAMTLLHCGAGLSYGLPNLHNAKRAGSMIVNCVGDLASDFQAMDSPLRTNVTALAGPVSRSVRTGCEPGGLGQQAAAAAADAWQGGIATLIVPADTAWGEGGKPAEPCGKNAPAVPGADDVEQAARLLAGGGSSALLLGGTGLRRRGLELAQVIAERTGAALLAPQAITRMERGGSLPSPTRIPVPPSLARETLAPFANLILIGTGAPTGFFSYPGQPPGVVPDSCTVLELCKEPLAGELALERLAAALDVRPAPMRAASRQAPPPCATGAVDPATIAQSATALLPEGAVVVDESVVMGRAIFGALAQAAPHSWLQVPGGAIGGGPPLATGAALASPGRRVVNFQADGSALYTAQALWTQVRERLDITTVILANRGYAVLQQEYARIGGQRQDVFHPLFDLGVPPIGWTLLAQSMGMEAARAETMDEFNTIFAAANRRSGPFLIELVC